MMELAQTEAGVLLLGLLFLFLGLGIWIGVSLMLVGLVGVVVLPVLIPAMPDLPRREGDGHGHLAVHRILDAGGAAAVHLDGRDPVPHEAREDMFRGLAPWVQRLPGRLMHVNIIGCGIFAAVSGSFRRDRGDDRQDVAARAHAARLPRAHGDRLAGRRRHAGAADPALDRHDRLWRRGRGFHRAAVHRRRVSRPAADRRCSAATSRVWSMLNPGTHAAARPADTDPPAPARERQPIPGDAGSSCS